MVMHRCSGASFADIHALPHCNRGVPVDTLEGHKCEEILPRLKSIMNRVFIVLSHIDTLLLHDTA